MKKNISMFLIVCLLSIFAAACSNKGVSETGDNDTKMLESSAVETDNNSSETQEIPTSTSEGVDVDLTKLSSTMVYAEVYNMMVTPDDYLGKIVKMSGSYYASYYEETEKYYHCMIIEDATACCQQGLEFIWNGDHTYPDDYPEDNTKIEVTGIFESYEELGQTYYCLAVDNIKILK